MLDNPDRPVLVIMGGAKVKDKILLINNLLERVNKMIITGGMAFTFLKAMHNTQIGKSICDEEGLKVVNDIVKKAKERNVDLLLPEDFVVSKEIKDNALTKIVTLSQGIENDWLGIDTGPLTQQKFNKEILSSKTIFLNGAAGVFECNIARSGSEGLVNVNKKLSSLFAKHHQRDQFQFVVEEILLI
jgi:phosphoglycerate kinase